VEIAFLPRSLASLKSSVTFPVNILESLNLGDTS
jgi:hypothetical protein